MAKGDSSAFSLVGFLTPGQKTDVPSFVTPLFVDKGKQYFQVIGPDARLQDFDAVEALYDDAAVLRAADDITVKPGDAPIYAFAFADDDVIFGSKKQLAQELRSRLDDERLVSMPFAKLSVASFVADERAINESIHSAATELSAVSPETADVWRKAIDAEFDEIRSEGTAVEGIQEKLNGFCQALLRFYHSYRRYLGVSSESYRKTRAWQYERAAQEVMRYYLDAEFYYLIRGELQRSAAQLTLPFRDINSLYEHYCVRSLGQLGVSRTQARSVLQSLNRPARAPQSAEYFISVLCAADRTMFTEAVLVRRLGKAEKKLRKRNLRTGALSLSFGLVLLLRSYDASQSGDQQEYARLRALAIEAVTAALADLGPPQEVRKEWDVAGTSIGQ